MRFIRASLGLVAVIAAMALTLTMSPVANAAGNTEAAAPQAKTVSPDGRAGCYVPRCWAAIAINPRNGGAAWAYNYGSKARVRSAVLNRCAKTSKSRCRVAATVRNGCVAAAYRYRGGRLVEWAGRYAFNKAPAIRKAKRAVAGRGTVSVAGWACSQRRG